MELRPADLGEAYQSAIVLKRAHGRSIGTLNSKRGRIDPWVKRTAGALKLAPGVEKETLPAVSAGTRGVPVGLALICGGAMIGGLGLPAAPDLHMALLAGPAAFGILANLVLRREVVRDIYRRSLRESEINLLRPAVSAPATQARWIESRLPTVLRDMLPPRPEVKTPATLESDYFDLVASILRLPEPDVDVRDELRDTLHQIGDAVSAIRRSEIEDEKVDARDLIGDAEILAARARREPDQVVAGSLLRQARAKVAQAKVVDGNVTLRRRTRALDAELRAQIAATRSTLRNLSSQGTMSLESNGSFRTIADSVRTLATEATSVNAARDELAAALRGEGVQQSPVGVDVSQRAPAAAVVLPPIPRQAAAVEESQVLGNGRGV